MSNIKEIKKENRILQRTIRDSIARTERLVGEKEELLRENAEKDETIQQLEEKIEKLQGIIARTKELLGEPKKTAEKKELAAGQKLKSEFIEAIKLMKEEGFNPQNRKHIILVTIIASLPKATLPESQRTFWQLIGAVYQAVRKESSRLETGVTRNECIAVIRALLFSTDLLKKGVAQKRKSRSEYYVFNPQSEWWEIISPTPVPMPRLDN